VAKNNFKNSTFENEFKRRREFVESFRSFDETWKTDRDKFIDIVTDKYNLKFGDKYGYEIINQSIRDWCECDELVESSFDESKKEEQGLTPAACNTVTHPLDQIKGLNNLLADRDRYIRSLETQIGLCIDAKNKLKEKSNWKVRLLVAGGLVSSFVLGFFIAVVLYNIYQ
jgi:hypothetical protein